MTILLHKTYLVKVTTKGGQNSKISKKFTTWFMDDPLVHILGVKKDQTSWVEEEIVLTQNAWSPPEYGIIRCGRISMEMATLQKGQWLRSPVYILLKSVLWVFDNADRNRIPDFWNLMHMLIDFVFLIFFFFWKTTQ